MESVQMAFKRPDMVPWGDVKSFYGAKEILPQT
jgi:hypothetical protein